MNKGSFQLIVPCDVQISGCLLLLELYVERENYEAAARVKKQIEYLRNNPKDEIIECKPITL